MIKIQTSGQKPESVSISTEESLSISTEKSLLIAAWAYGLKENESIHRFSLFAFVQSHIKDAPEENLQGFIEKDSSNWTGIRKGNYKLTSLAFKQILDLDFDTPKVILPKNILYTFKRQIENSEISVTVDTVKRKYIVKQDNCSRKAVDVVEYLKIKKFDIPTKDTSKPRKVFNWILSGDYHWTIDTTIEETISLEVIERFKDLDEEEVFSEGKEKYSVHKSKERNQKLVARKKQEALSVNPNLPCEICKFSFKERYGELGDKFIEAHHIFPISELTEATETKLEDLILVCSNCHKMIHRTRPWLTKEEIKRFLK
ncbi:HNH endonuclease [Cylindrospermum stagnale]|nr:HNH endonuclease [Cylindrospermum stagnale]